jgi:hypothetical protein
MTKYLQIKFMVTRKGNAMKSDVGAGLELNFLTKKPNVNLLWRDPGVYASLNSAEKCRNNR